MNLLRKKGQCTLPYVKHSPIKKYNNFTNSLVLSIVVYIMYTVDINESKEKLNAIELGYNSWK